MDQTNNKSKKELPKPGTSTKQVMRSIIEEFVESGDIEEAMEDIKKNVQIRARTCKRGCNFRNGTSCLRKGTSV